MPTRTTAVLAGCGSISAAWFQALVSRRDVRIVAVADPNREAAERRIAEFCPGAAYFPTLEAALNATAPDAVFDCSIPDAHAANSILALGRGCHVLSEKPLAATVADARQILAAETASGKIHAVIQNRRYLPEIVPFRKAVRERIGGLTTLNADFYLGAHFGGFRDVMKHVLLLDMAIHSFDQARFISGCDPVSVYCVEWNPKGSWYAHDACAMAIFTMSDGVMFNYRGSWCAEGLDTPWECEWRAVGTTGTAIWNGAELRGENAIGETGFHRARRKFPIRPAKLKFTGHAGVINEFLTSIRKGAKPQTECHDNIKSLAMVTAAIESAESGRVVPVRY